MENIYLINPGNDGGYTSMANYTIFPALGVISLGTSVQESFPQYEVKVFDGQVQDELEILQCIKVDKPDVVGVSVLATNYRSSLSYAQAAKNVGATVIFGNDQVALHGRNMLNQRGEIDYGCTADVGEFAFLKFLEYLEGNCQVAEVPQLLYRTTRGIEHNDIPEIPDASQRLGRERLTLLDKIPIADRGLLPSEAWDTYKENYVRKYGKLHKDGVSGVTTMNRARGCARGAIEERKCCYCGIKDLTMRFSSPEMFWGEVTGAKDQLGISGNSGGDLVMYEVFDSLSSAPRWVQSLVDAKPDEHNDVRFFVYAQAIETTPKLVGMFKKLGVFRANMGLDSGNDLMLQRMKGSRDSVAQNKRAVQLLKDAGINVYASIVLGAPGENRDTLEETIRFGEWLVDGGYIAGLEVQPLYPIFNTQAGKMLLDVSYARGEAQRLSFTIHNEELLRTLRGKYLGSESPNTDEITREWSEIFCDVSHDELVSVTEQMNRYAAGHGMASGSAILKKTEQPQ